MPALGHGCIHHGGQMVTADGRIALTADEVCFRDDAYQLLFNVDNRHTTQVVLDQNMGDVLYCGCGFDCHRG
jgi:hypothetical protein